MKHELNTDQAELGTNTGRPGRTAVRKSGRLAGKWTGFSHFATALTRLFPRKSTQVVDFPRMYDVSVFWGRSKKEPPRHEGTEAGETWNQGGYGGENLCKKLRIVTHCYGKVREVSRKFAQIRPVIPRLFALLRVRPIFLGEEAGNQGERRRFCLVLFGFWANALKIGSAI
jgi:hypothetical protein